MMVSNTDHCYNIFTYAPNPPMGEIFWRWKRDNISTYAVSVFLSSLVYHFLNDKAYWDPADRESSGNRKTLNVALAPYGSSV